MSGKAPTETDQPSLGRFGKIVVSTYALLMIPAVCVLAWQMIPHGYDSQITNTGDTPYTVDQMVDGTTADFPCTISTDHVLTIPAHSSCTIHYPPLQQ